MCLKNVWKIPAFWYVVSFGLAEIYQLFWRIYCLVSAPEDHRRRFLRNGKYITSYTASQPIKWYYLQPQKWDTRKSRPNNFCKLTALMCSSVWVGGICDWLKWLLFKRSVEVMTISVPQKHHFCWLYLTSSHAYRLLLTWFGLRQFPWKFHSPDLMQLLSSCLSNYDMRWSQ